MFGKAMEMPHLTVIGKSSDPVIAKKSTLKNPSLRWMFRLREKSTDSDLQNLSLYNSPSKIFESIRMAVQAVVFLLPLPSGSMNYYYELLLSIFMSGGNSVDNIVSNPEPEGDAHRLRKFTTRHVNKCFLQ